MSTFREYDGELTSLEKSVADEKKSIQAEKERQIGVLDSKYSRFLKNLFIIGEDEQARYKELMESGLCKKKQELEEQEKKDLEVQDKRIDSFKSMNNGCEYRVYQALKGVIDDEEEEKKIYEREIGVIQMMIEQLKRELDLKKLEQGVVSQRKDVLELLDIELGALNQIKADYKWQLFGTLADTIGNDDENAVQLTAIQERILLLEKEIPGLEKQLRSKKLDCKQILKELKGISSETPEEEKQMSEALKCAEIGILMRKLREPLQSLMDQYGVGKEFVGILRRYLRKEWKISRGKAFLTGDENVELQIPQKHINQWMIRYGGDFVQGLEQLLRKEGIKMIQEKSKDEGKNNKGTKKPETSNQPISSEENKNRSIIQMLENSNSISDSISILRYLGFKFENGEAFINQVKEAQNEGLQGVAENINRWIAKYMIGTGTIDYRKTKNGGNWYRIALSCNGRNPRILLKKNKKGDYTIVCIAPHEDYENILLGQTKNYFQTWKGNWMERGENGGKKGRA